jgi:hypothetical protein
LALCTHAHRNVSLLSDGIGILTRQSKRIKEHLFRIFEGNPIVFVVI